MKDKPREPAIRIEAVYGFNAVRPYCAVRLVEPPAPSVADMLRGIFYELILPAFLFALCVTALKFAILGHF